MEQITTSTEWRDDAANLDLTQKLNEAYVHLPFSREYEGVLDECPVRLSWAFGPNLPVAWKGGAAGVIDGRIVLAGGLWMPGRSVLAYAYDPQAQTYEPLPPPPFSPEYTQGVAWNNQLYLVSGRGAQGRVAALTPSPPEGERGETRGCGVVGLWGCEDLTTSPPHHLTTSPPHHLTMTPPHHDTTSPVTSHQSPVTPEGAGMGVADWQWTDLPPLPEPAGRWLAAVQVLDGKWLVIFAGDPSGTSSEQRTAPALPDWRLRLDAPEAGWEPMAAYPGGVRALVASAVVGGQLYAFGGSHPEPTMRRLFLELSKQYNLPIVPYNGVPQYRDAYRYDAGANQWSPLRRLPFPMSGGAGVPYQDRYVLILGTTETKTSRVGQAKWGDPRFWHGYNDVILCYDTVQDNYSRVGVMPYGVATCPWLRIGDTLYGFGGEPCHGFNDNTENVLQIGTILPADLDNGG
jgi:hypothetical protein